MKKEYKARLSNNFFTDSVISYKTYFIISLIILFFLLFQTQDFCYSPKLNQVSETSNIMDVSISKDNNVSIFQTRSGLENGLNLSYDFKTQYLIISHQEFEKALEPLATWKTIKGVPTKIYTVDSPEGIYPNYVGVDNASKIHSFLREYYKYTPNLKWLLIVGDSDKIPTRMIYNNPFEKIEDVLLVDYSYSDYYYSALDSTWDDNLNQIYGEPGEEDWDPELYVGRLPVNTLDEVKNAVNKILIYEKSPPTGDWFAHTIQCGALMDRPNVLDDPDTAFDEGYDYYKDNAFKVIRKIWNILPKNLVNSTFLDYNRILGGDYSKKNDTLNEENALSAFNLGASTVNFVSKGDDNGVRHYDGSGISWLEYSSKYFFSYYTSKKVENGFKLPLLYTSSCTSVNFTNTDDTNLEFLIISPTGGAIGVIGATTETYRLEFEINNSSYGNWWLNEQFWKRFYNGTGNYSPGEILYQLKKDYYIHFTNTSNPYGPSNLKDYPLYSSLYRTNFFSYNLLGDPEVPIYTDIPHKLYIEYEKIFSPLKRNAELKIKVLDDVTMEPVEGAVVCIMNDNRYLVTHTDNEGNAIFQLEISGSESLNFTVTAHNYYYYSSNIKVKPKTDVLIKQEDIKFDRNPIPPDAVVNISFSVINNGTQDVSELKIYCYYDQISPSTLINSTLDLEYLPANSKINLSVIWRSNLDSHTIIFLADPYDEIFEFNEENNIASSELIVNPPPKIGNLNVIKIFEDTPAINILDLSKFIWDDDPDSLHFQISNISNPDCNISVSKSFISIFPPLNWFGTVTANVTVFDGVSYDGDLLTIIIQSVNDPPTINNTEDWIINSNNVTVKSDHILVYEDHLVDIMLTANDIDDNSSVFQFGVMTDLFFINPQTGRILFIPNNNDVGIHTINFSITDGHEINNMSWRTVEFEIINTNDPPKIYLNRTHYFVTVGKRLEFSVKAIDNDPNDSISFSDDTELFDIEPSSGLISFDPDESQIGMHHIKISVSDGNVTDSRIIIIEIKARPEEPLDPQYILICPVILFLLVILIVAQEYLKNKKRTKNKEI